MSERYILDGQTPVPATLEQWIAWCGTISGRITSHVAQEKRGDVRVSTVFLSINHQWGDGPPEIFETMIFGGEHDEWQDRCATWEQAEAMHKRACAMAFGEAA